MNPDGWTVEQAQALTADVNVAQLITHLAGNDTVLTVGVTSGDGVNVDDAVAITLADLREGAGAISGHEIDAYTDSAAAGVRIDEIHLP